MSPSQRFDAKVRRGMFGCLIWTGGSIPQRGSTRGNRYGWFYWNGRQGPAHRFAYERAKGPIPDGLTIDHLCRNSLCQNVDHLEAVTLQENLARAYRPRRDQTHCKRGHPLSGENAYPYRNKRICRACWRKSPRVEVAA